MKKQQKILDAFGRIITDKRFNKVSNFTLLFLYILFLYRHIMVVLLGGASATILLFVAMEGLLVFFIVTRTDPVRRTTDTYAWAAALIGTFIPLGLNTNAITLSYTYGTGFIIFGALFALMGYASLNKSFGITPAVRVVKTSGLYSFVRHPIYASYIPMYIGYVLILFTPANAALIVLGISFQGIRVYFEEKLLSQTEEYKLYKKKVPWRFIPGIV